MSNTIPIYTLKQRVLRESHRVNDLAYQLAESLNKEAEIEIDNKYVTPVRLNGFWFPAKIEWLGERTHHTAATITLSNHWDSAACEGIRTDLYARIFLEKENKQSAAHARKILETLTDFALGLSHRPY